MPDRLKVTVLAVDRRVLETEAEAVVAAAPAAELSILPDHIEAVTPLEVDSLLLKGTDEGDLRLAVHGGTLYTDGERVMVLAETAELPGEIDVRRAEAAKERAEGRLEQAEKREEINVVRAEAALKRALLRINVARDWESAHGR